MLTDSYLQTSPKKHATLEHQEADHVYALKALSISEPSPYVTPMVQYYIEREAEWARG